MVTIMMSGTLNGRVLPAHTAYTVLRAFVPDVQAHYFSGYEQGLRCEDGDYYWLRDHHCSVWEDYELEGDAYGMRLEDAHRRRLLAPDEQVCVLYAVSSTRAHMQIMTVEELATAFQIDASTYRIIITR